MDKRKTWSIADKEVYKAILDDRYYKFYGQLPSSKEYDNWSAILLECLSEITLKTHLKRLLGVATEFIDYTPIDLILTTILKIDEITLDEWLNKIG